MKMAALGTTRRRLERGVASLEYVVVGAAILVLVGVVGTSTDVGQSLTRGVGYNICRAASGVTGAACTPPSSTEGGSDDGTDEPLRPGDDGYNGQTPEEQATNGDYVALGDSYSSGEGAGDYIDDTDDSKSWGFWADDYENMCHRSANAYTATTAASLGFDSDSYSSHACSGSVMVDYYSPNHKGDEAQGEGPQGDAVRDKKPSLVTISMGGNDFGFGEVLGSCIQSDCFENPGEIDDKKAEIYQKIYGVKPGETVDYQNPPKDSLLKLYQDMRADAGPDARLLIVGYPQLFPDEDKITNGGDSFISPAEQGRLNDIGAYVNSQLAAATDNSPSSVEFVDVTDALKGHEVGTDDPWINDLDLGRGGPAGTSQESFHPKATGNNAIADIVEEHVRKGRK